MGVCPSCAPTYMPGTNLNKSEIVRNPEALIMSRSMTVMALGASDNGCAKRDALSTTGKSCRISCSDIAVSAADARNEWIRKAVTARQTELRDKREIDCIVGALIGGPELIVYA